MTGTPMGEAMREILRDVERLRRDWPGLSPEGRAKSIKAIDDRLGRVEAARRPAPVPIQTRRGGPLSPGTSEAKAAAPEGSNRLSAEERAAKAKAVSEGTHRPVPIPENEAARRASAARALLKRVAPGSPALEAFRTLDEVKKTLEGPQPAARPKPGPG